MAQNFEFLKLAAKLLSEEYINRKKFQQTINHFIKLSKHKLFIYIQNREINATSKCTQLANLKSETFFWLGRY